MQDTFYLTMGEKATAAGKKKQGMCRMLALEFNFLKLHEIHA